MDAEGGQLILSHRVSQCASDRNELVAGIEAIPREVGQPATVLGDSGFAHGDEVETLRARRIEVLVATGSEAKKRRHDFRPGYVGRSVKEPKAEWLKEMSVKLQLDGNQEKYRLRKQTVEPVLGIIKNVPGFSRFSLRGLNKVEIEWALVSLAYNCKCLRRLAG